MRSSPAAAAALLCACSLALDPSGFVRGDGGADADGGAADAAPSPDDAGGDPGGSFIRVVEMTEGTVRVRGVLSRGSTATEQCTVVAEDGDCVLQDCRDVEPRSDSGGRLRVESPRGFFETGHGPSGYLLTTGTLGAEPADPVTFRTEGDVVPAFEGDVPFPAGRDYAWVALVDRRSSYSTGWLASEVAADRVELRLEADGGREVRCVTRDLAAETVRASAGLMQQMPAGPTRGEVRFVREGTVDAGSYRVRLEVAAADEGTFTLE